MLRDWLLSLVDYSALDDDDAALLERSIATLSGTGEPAALAAMDIVRLIGETRDPDALLAALVAPALIDPDEKNVVEVILLILHVFAATRKAYGDQPSAVAAREAVSARADATWALVDNDTLDRDTLDWDTLDWLINLVGEAVNILSELAATLVPMVRVETAISLPSSLIAFDLYGDAARGHNLVERNRASAPLVMPLILEAPAS